MRKHKRLPEGAIRVTNSDGKVSVTVPMTKGRALIAVRSILGPSAGVAQVGQCMFVTNHGMAIAIGHSWDPVVKLARDSKAAQAWSDAEIDESNYLEGIKDSIKKLTRVIAGKNLTRHFKELETRWAKKAETTAQNAEYYQLWKEGREEDYQAALARTQGRHAMGPANAAAVLEEEKLAAKAQRRREYNGAPA